MRRRGQVPQLVREHQAEVLRLEADELRRLVGIYEAARREILARLSEFRAESFTAQSYRVALAQVQAGLDAMLAKLRSGHGERLDVQLSLAVRQMLAEIGHFERLSGFAAEDFGGIELDALQRLSEQRGLLLQRFQTSIDRYGLDVIGEVQRRLGVHLVKRSSWRDMALDIAGKVQSAAIPGALWRAERIVRTEMHHALNVGHQAALEQAARSVPGLMREWDATLDRRTSEICRTLDGQVRPLDEPWTYQGREYGQPPAHPNCRSRLTPWRAEWGDTVRQAPARPSARREGGTTDELVEDVRRPLIIVPGARPAIPGFVTEHPQWSDMRRMIVRGLRARDPSIPRDAVDAKLNAFVSAVQFWKRSGARLVRRAAVGTLGEHRQELAAARRALAVLDEILPLLPGHKGVIHRGERWGAGERSREFVVAALQNATVIAIHYPQGYSTDVRQAEKFGHGTDLSLTVHGRTSARSVRNIGGYATQSELISTRPSTLRVVEWRWNQRSGHVFVEAEEVLGDEE